MPITIPDDVKRITADAAQAIYFSLLKLEHGLSDEDAERIARWMSDSYMEGWKSGVEQSINMLKTIR